MNEGLEKLKTIRHIHDMECGKDESINKDFDIIEKELKEKETQDNYIKMLEDRIDNLETTYLRNRKTLEIIKKKRVNLEYLRFCTCLEDYNDIFIEKWQLTQEEYDLLKEELL